MTKNTCGIIIACTALSRRGPGLGCRPLPRVTDRLFSGAWWLPLDGSVMPPIAENEFEDVCQAIRYSSQNLILVAKIRAEPENAEYARQVISLSHCFMELNKVAGRHDMFMPTFGLTSALFMGQVQVVHRELQRVFKKNGSSVISRWSRLKYWGINLCKKRFWKTFPII